METTNLDQSNKYPLIVIVGPTASGKTSLAIKIAQKYGGEIICADSRSIYKGLDIGTAKPSRQEQAGIPHWGLDLVDPGQRFTAADFKDYANDKIAQIRKRHRLPIIVGGSGLYVDAVIFDYQFGDDAEKATRDKLQMMPIKKLVEYCNEHNIELPENTQNKRYLVRAIEQKGINNSRRQRPISTSIIVGIATDRAVLRQRITQRAEQIFADSVVKEAIEAGQKYGWDNQAMTGNIYPLVRQFQLGELSLEEVKAKFITLDCRLAKRQMTWFKRNKYIYWGDVSQVSGHIDQLLEQL